MMHEQHDTMLREVLVQMKPVASVRLLTCIISTNDNLHARPACPVDEMLATTMQLRAEAFAYNTTPGLESSHASLSVASPVPTSSQILWAHTPPPHV